MLTEELVGGAPKDGDTNSGSGAGGYPAAGIGGRTEQEVAVETTHVPLVDILLVTENARRLRAQTVLAQAPPQKFYQWD